MQPKCPKCGEELQIGKAKMYCVKDRCRWEETTVHDLISRTNNQEVYSIVDTVKAYLISQSIRLGIESDRITKVEEKIMDLDRKFDKQN